MRDLRIARRRWSQFALPPLFLVVVASLFPMGISPSAETLNLVAPGVIWIAALLAALLALDTLFRADYDDGVLELLALGHTPWTMVVFARLAAHWLLTGLPLVLVTPLVGVMYALPGDVTTTMIIGLLLGTPVLSALGGIAAALTVSLPRSGALLALLVLPLCVPVLIFGTRAAAMTASGLPADGPLYLLAALLVLAVTLAPFAAAMALRISLE
jgi:heme exporter protein B